MTPDEDREARAFADAFTARMRETRDVSALVSDIFIPEFPAFWARVLARTDSAGIIVNLPGFNVFHPTVRVQTRLGEKGLATMYARTANFWYLMMLRRLSELPPGAGDRMAMTEFVPVDVGMVLRKDRALARVLDAPFGLIMSDSPVSRSRKQEVDDVEQARRSIDALGRFTDGLRRLVARAEESPGYAEWKKLIEVQIDATRGRASLVSRATVCARGCAGLPDGTRFLEVMALPFWHLHLVRTPAGLRLAVTDLPTD